MSESGEAKSQIATQERPKSTKLDLEKAKAVAYSAKDRRDAAAAAREALKGLEGGKGLGNYLERRSLKKGARKQDKEAERVERRIEASVDLYRKLKSSEAAGKFIDEVLERVTRVSSPESEKIKADLEHLKNTAAENLALEEGLSNPVADAIRRIALISVSDRGTYDRLNLQISEKRGERNDARRLYEYLGIEESKDAYDNDSKKTFDGFYYGVDPRDELDAPTGAVTVILPERKLDSLDVVLQPRLQGPGAWTSLTGRVDKAFLELEVGKGLIVGPVQLPDLP